MRRLQDHPDHPSPALSRQAARGGVMLVLVLGPLLLAVGCNQQKHYRLLSFFFDGVPLPEHMRADLEQFDEATGQRRRPQDLQETVIFYHEPYQTRECYGCHDRDQAFEVTTNDSRSCRGCHESYFQILPGDWVHGPTAMGMCGHCHMPHKSENPGLLTAAQPDICFQCHEAELVTQDAFHSRLDDLTCSRCHDPHAAGNRRLLADSRTYRRSKRIAAISEHPVWKYDECSKCHNEDQSNVLEENVERVCLECHAEVRDTSTGLNIHKAVTEGRCTTCHTAHKSTRPHLIRPTAEQICFACHTYEEIATPQHPPVVRGECLTCHTGHHALRPKLLRPGIFGPDPLIPDGAPVARQAADDTPAEPEGNQPLSQPASIDAGGTP